MTMTVSSPLTTRALTSLETRSFEHSDGAIRSLEAVLDGRVILPGDKAYDESRQIRNMGIDRFPAIIVQVAAAGDVAQAVRFARDYDLRIAVRSGGHSFSGHSVIDGGIVIDLRNLSAITIDPRTRIARVQPGATSAMLAAAAQVHSLALSTGDVSSVAVGGLTLGGGIGWMVREQGLTIDNLRSVQMVSAESEIIRASASENPDLFWALRGGGGNFGIVTEFEFQLHEVGTVLAGALALPPTPEALRGYAEWAMKAPNAMTTITYILPAPPAPFVPAEMVGEVVMFVIACYTGDAQEGQAVLDGLRQVATPLFEMVAPMPYPAIYDFTQEGTLRTREASRSLFMRELPDDVIEAIVATISSMSPTSMIQLRVLGGRMAEVPPVETAFAHRTSPYVLTIVRGWQEGEGAADTDWVNSFFERVRGYSTGVYANFTQNEDHRVGEAYPPETYRRLAEVKQNYDPSNVFAMNLNIRPDAR